jgi:hypothetical protein
MDEEAIDETFNTLITKYKENQIAMAQITQELGMQFAQGISDIFTALITNIGNSEADFRQIITNILKQLGIAIARMLVMKALLTAFGLPGGVGVSGIAQAVTGGVPAFAKGGKVTGPTLAIVGDNPSGTEFITPTESLGQLAGLLASKMSGMGGGGMLSGKIDIAGEDLRVVLNRATQKNTR